MAASTTQGTTSFMVGRGNPPTLGAADLRSFVDDIFGVPYTNPGYALPGLQEQSRFVESLPELLFGTNRTNLGQKIIKQALMDDNFFTNVLAPVQQLDWGQSLEVQWDSITIHPQLPTETAEEGPVRIGSWEYSSDKDTVRRYGSGAEFGHDFLLDPKGQNIARMRMEQLMAGIMTHLQLGVMHAIQHCRDHAVERERQRFSETWKSRKAHEFFTRTKKYFAILQKRVDAIPLIKIWVTEEMKEYGGQWDTALFHWKMAQFVTSLNPKLTDYSSIGPSAESNFNSSIDSFGSLGGEGRVYIIRSFDVDRERGPLDLLKRRTTIGEIVQMSDHIKHHYGSYEGYQTSWRSVRIMNGDAGEDKRSTITLEAALAATGAWDIETDGALKGPDHPDLQRYADAKDPNKRCTFWYSDASGKQRAASLFGQILRPYFSVDSALNLARTVVGSDKRVQNALRVLSEALDAMASYPLSDSKEDRDMITAYARDGARSVPATSRTPLPPLLASAEGLRAIATYARSKTDAEIRTAGYSVEQIRGVAEAVNVVEPFVRRLQSVFPNSIFLARNNAFASFIDNCLSRPRFRLYLRKSVAGSGSPAAVAAAPQRIDEAFNVLQRVVQRIRQNVTGNLTTVADATSRAAGDLPATLGISATINAGAAADSDALIESVQPNADGVQPNAGAIVAAMPALAKARYPTVVAAHARWLAADEAGKAAALAALTAAADAIGLRAAATGLRYKYARVAVPANEAEKIANAYDAAVRLLLNALPVSTATSSEALSAIKGRALALSMLAIVETAGTPLQVAERINAIAAVLKAAGVVDVDALSSPVAPVPAEAKLYEQIRAAYASGAFNTSTFIKMSANGVNKERDAQNVIDTLGRSVANLDKDSTAFLASATVESVGLSGYAASDYVLSPLRIDGSSDYIARLKLGSVAPILVPGDPEHDTPITQARLEVLQRRGSAPVNVMIAASIRRAVRSTETLHLDNPYGVATAAGGLPDVEMSARRSENYGITRDSDLIRYDTPGSSGSGSDDAMDVDAGISVSSRYRSSTSRAASSANSLGTAYARAPINGSAFDNADETLTNGFMELWDELAARGDADNVLASIVRVFYGTPTNWANVKALLANNVLVPFTVLLARPLIVLHTYSIYMVKAGLETMRTLFGQVNTTWGNDTQRQVYQLTTHFKSKTMVTNFRNIYHIPNAFICGLERGFGVDFFTPKSFRDCVEAGRIEGTDSIVPILEPYEQYLERSLEPCISLTGAFKFLDVAQFRDQPEVNDRLHYYNASFANCLWGFRTYARSGRLDDKSRQLHGLIFGKNASDLASFDFVCWASQSLHWHPSERDFTYKRPSRGFFDDDTYGPGMMTAMRESHKHFKQQDYSRMHDI